MPRRFAGDLNFFASRLDHPEMRAYSSFSRDSCFHEFDKGLPVNGVVIEREKKRVNRMADTMPSPGDYHDFERSLKAANSTSHMRYSPAPESKGVLQPVMSEKKIDLFAGTTRSTLSLLQGTIGSTSSEFADLPLRSEGYSPETTLQSLPPGRPATGHDALLEDFADTTESFTPSRHRPHGMSSTPTLPSPATDRGRGDTHSRPRAHTSHGPTSMFPSLASSLKKRRRRPPTVLRPAVSSDTTTSETRTGAASTASPLPPTTPTASGPSTSPPRASTSLARLLVDVHSEGRHCHGAALPTLDDLYLIQRVGTPLFNKWK